MTATAPGRVREWPLAAVLASFLAGLILAVGYHFRWGSLVVAAAVLLGGGLRLVLPARRAGLLAVRSRWTDVAVLTLLGLAIATLALVVPRPY